MRHFLVPSGRRYSNPARSNMVRVPLCRNEDEVFLPWTSFGKESTVPPPYAAMRSNRALECGLRHPATAVVAVDEEAGDPIRRRRLVQAGLVLLAVVDVRQLLRRAVLAPGDGGAAVEHQSGVRTTRPDQVFLPALGELGALGFLPPLGAARLDPARREPGGTRCTSSRPTPRCASRRVRRTRARSAASMPRSDMPCRPRCQRSCAAPINSAFLGTE